MKIITNVMQGTILGLALGVMTSTALSGEVINRGKNKHTRIPQEVQSGELYRPDAEHSREMQQKIKDGRENAESDGTVTESERSGINVLENKPSESIFHSKRNSRRPRR